MKTIVSLCFLLLFSIMLVSPLAAQPPGGRPKMDREDIESMKIAFLTRKLSLSPEEAQKFWPVYNSFADEIKNIKEGRAERMKDSKESFANMPDKDVEKLIDAEISSRQQELDVLKKYHSQFKQTLPIKKVAMLYRAEEDFKRELIEKIREKRMEKRGPGRD